jgi:regulatory protein
MEIKQPRQKSPAEALEALMERCARAEICLWDARRLLTRWGVPRGEWKAILDRLESERFIDERRYAEAYVRDRLQFSRWGVRKIADALYRKQIPRRTVDRALEPIDPEAMADRLETDLRRKNASIRDTDPRKRRDKLIRFGLSRGFEIDRILETVGAIVRPEEE